MPIRDNLQAHRWAEFAGRDFARETDRYNLDGKLTEHPPVRPSDVQIWQAATGWETLPVTGAQFTEAAAMVGHFEHGVAAYISDYEGNRGPMAFDGNGELLREYEEVFTEMFGVTPLASWLDEPTPHTFWLVNNETVLVKVTYAPEITLSEVEAFQLEHITYTAFQLRNGGIL